MSVDPDLSVSIGAAPPSRLPIIFRLRHISKSFGPLRALDDVSLDLAAGEVVALVGDNGAGKSTLVKVMNGFHRPDSGTLTFLDRDVRFSSPVEARALGIETVYQDLALIGELSLWRNFFVGREIWRGPSWLGWLDSALMRTDTLRSVEALGISGLRSAEEPVRVLSGGERQAVAIARAWYFGAKFLLLDEPTSALSVKETRKLAESIAQAKRLEIGMVIVDHNIEHVHPIADRLVLLANGSVEDVFAQRDITAGELADRVAGAHRLTFQNG